MLRELLRVLELSLRELRASERELLSEEQEEAAPTAASAGAGVGASSPQAAAHTPRRRAGETMRPRGGGVAGETPARGRRKREAAHAARPADDTAAGRQLRRSEELHREAVARRARHEQAQEAFALSLAHILGGAGGAVSCSEECARPAELALGLCGKAKWHAQARIPCGPKARRVGSCLNPCVCEYNCECEFERV